MDSKSSPATTYLLSVLEKKTHEDTFHLDSGQERVAKAFKALSDIISKVGIYSPVLRLVKEELFEAVYSNTITVSPDTELFDSKSIENRKQKSLTPLPTIPLLVRVPYFELLQKQQNDKTETIAKFTSEIFKLTETIKKHEKQEAEKDAEIQSLNEIVSGLKSHLASCNLTIEDKNVTIEDLNADLENLMLETEFEKQKTNEKIDEMEKDISDLRDKVKILAPFKSSYMMLKDTFDLPADKRPRRGFRRPILSTNKTKILSSIEAASKLEQQILEVQNKTLEEQDSFLEEIKSKLTKEKFSNNKSDPNYFTEELLLENLSDEMAARLSNFRRLISGLVVELELIRQHRETLQTQLGQLEQARHIPVDAGDSTAGTIHASSMAGGRPGSSRLLLFDDVTKKPEDSVMSLGESLEEDHTPMNATGSNPFNPIENVLSKYSAMLYTSRNGGKTFDEVPIAKFCISCGEKTVVCPHKITKDDLVISLPKACSHVKIVRPHVRHITSLSQQGARMTASSMQPESESWLSENKTWDTSSNNWSKISQTRSQLNSLWSDFKDRTGSEKAMVAAVSRDLSHSRTLSIIEQFCASVLHHDDIMISKHGSFSSDDIGVFKDYLYKFISERYQDEEVIPLASYDLLAAITKYSEHDKMILTVGLGLTGNLDGAITRYVILLADVINMMIWDKVADFHAFVEIVHSFMHEDDIDQFAIEYTAFSENKISKFLVMDYIIHNIIKNKDPKIQDAEMALSGIVTTEEGLMTMEEYSGAMESIFPLANVRLWKKLMLETFKTCDKEAIPIQRLAAITAYANLVQIEALIKDNISELNKDHAKEDDDVDKERLICANDMRVLAGNISRQKSALEYRNAQFGDTFSRPNTEGSL